MQNYEILHSKNPNNWLTNGEVYSKEVLLGKFDSTENWEGVNERPENENESEETI